MGLRVDVHVWVYVLLIETTLLYTLLAFYFWIENDSVMNILLFIHFGFASSWKWRDLFMYNIYVIEESDVRKENLCYIIWCLNRNNCIVNSFYRVLIILRGITTSRIPLITFVIIHFFHMFICLEKILLCLNFQRVYSVCDC